MARDTATHVAGLFRGLEERIGQTLDTGVAEAGFRAAPACCFGNLPPRPDGQRMPRSMTRRCGLSAGLSAREAIAACEPVSRTASEGPSPAASAGAPERTGFQQQMPAHSHQYQQVASIYRGNRLPNWHAPLGQDFLLANHSNLLLLWAATSRTATRQGRCVFLRPLPVARSTFASPMSMSSSR